MRTAFAIVWAAALCAGVSGCNRGPQREAQPIAAREPVLGWRAGSERAESLPISLTASDGTGLTLVSLDVRAVVEAPLAFTELHLRFRNPEPRRREGRFQISLPQGAAISRFAMRVGDVFQEGEVVERRRAQAVYEDFLHRKQDPALLENAAGNEFAARVFPIEANADKEIIIAYSQELAERETPYVVLLKGLPQLAELAAEVRVGQRRLRLNERNYVPASDLALQLPAAKPVALRSGNLVLARVAPIVEVPNAAFSGLTVLFDTSASRALGFGAQIERLSALLDALRKRSGEEFDVRVIGFDQSSEELYRGPSSEFGLRAKAKLLARDALGASDLGQALAYLAKAGGAHPRLLVMSDGVITAGSDDATQLREGVAKLAAHGVRRLDVVAEGGIQDRDTLAILTRAGLPETGVLLDARSTPDNLATRLLRGVKDRVQVNIAGADWVYPSTLEGLQPGDERLVYAELAPETPVQIELVGAGAEAHETREVPQPLLERAWARAKIEAAELALRSAAPEAELQRGRLEREIVGLSVKYRVVSDFTALLVLESADDYRRFGLAQNALTNILRVGEDGLELWDRRDLALPQIARGDTDSTQEAIGAATTEVTEEREAPFAEGAVRPERKRSGSETPAGALRARNTSELELADGFGARDKAKDEAPAKGRAQAEPSSVDSATPAAVSAPKAAAPAPASPAASLARRSAPAERSTSLGALDSVKAASGEAARKPSPASSGAAIAIDEPRSSPAPSGAAIAIDEPERELRPNVRLLAASNLPRADTQRPLRGAVTARARQCFERSTAALDGARLRISLAIDARGAVSSAYSPDSVGDAAAQSCFLNGLRGVPFPKPDGERGSVEAQLSWSLATVTSTQAPVAVARSRPAVRVATPSIADAYGGTLAEVLQLLQRGDVPAALARATAARADDPADVMSLVALGEALEAQRDYARAARAYGSLIDLFPSRADLRRMASARLERLPSDGLTLAVDSYRRAVQQRPDHPSGHRALAYALLKQSDRAQAFEVLERALERSYAFDRFEGIDRILREDLGLVGAAWLRVDPSAESRVRASLDAHGATLDRNASTRFVLQWETDANDVDFHVYDGRGGHAYYMQRKLGSGGVLYADITTGYGPECFAIPGKAKAYPYVMQAHYFARGPMGYGMGKLQVVQHDGRGGLAFAEHPFVIMKDKAFVELARLTGPLTATQTL